MHLAGVADRRGWTGLARLLARGVTLEVNRATIAKILDTRFVLAITESGGCAVDVDTEQEYDAVRERYDDWIRAQQERSERLYGRLPARLEDAS